MTWQDTVFSVGSWIFSLALLPTVVGREKPALSTSLLTATVLAVFAFTYTTLSLWISGISTAMTSTMWWIIAFQKVYSLWKSHSSAKKTS